MSQLTKKMAEASTEKTPSPEGTSDTPRHGERFRCAKCGMEIQVTHECGCQGGDHVSFRCCGQELQRVVV